MAGTDTNLTAAAAAPNACGHASSHGCAHAQADHNCAGEKTPAFNPDALISARGVSVTRGGRDQLIDVNLDINEREIVTLIGPNGAGKSTLVRVLLGLEKPTRGEVHRRADLRIGYVPQRFDSDVSVPMTVERFLTLGLGRNGGRVEDLLRQVDAASVAQQQLGQLSGGELQRVLLARALLRKPNLLVLDEPAQGVDYSGEADLYNLIGRLRDEAGFGVLLVSHDLHIVMARSDRVVCLNRHVCCSGVPQAVAQHPAYGRLFGPQAARAFGIYRHEHDHHHDLAGMPHPASGDNDSDSPEGGSAC
ncbi:Zinc ABC transporter, ATP-binding protein ZnuC [Hyphomicrobium sulfonivorans]|uniref:Zinc ABC transporter, ATP-binding protein ZnuC n=1 Tax=Hyphomicrobium sulfonivorans TaxID=121290 RepID=A0A125NU75_HYPSL|nr:metal ABC transporter ATP-binding protein [Hyphomicrobium sulfonivorans]KWT65789.1 Zinc ABC transporter, ATP-binding protein ZnuC [Hyphomicrobium sulfonivorans]